MYKNESDSLIVYLTPLIYKSFFEMTLKTHLDTTGVIFDMFSYKQKETRLEYFHVVSNIESWAKSSRATIWSKPFSIDKNLTLLALLLSQIRLLARAFIHIYLAESDVIPKHDQSRATRDSLNRTWYVICSSTVPRLLENFILKIFHSCGSLFLTGNSWSLYCLFTNMIVLFDRKIFLDILFI